MNPLTLPGAIINHKSCLLNQWRGIVRLLDLWLTKFSGIFPAIELNCRHIPAYAAARTFRAMASGADARRLSRLTDYKRPFFTRKYGTA
jgi:hypothetical protein